MIHNYNIILKNFRQIKIIIKTQKYFLICLFNDLFWIKTKIYNTNKDFLFIIENLKKTTIGNKIKSMVKNNYLIKMVNSTMINFLIKIKLI